MSGAPPSAQDLGDGNDLAPMPALAREALLRRIADPRGGPLIKQLRRPETAPKLLGTLTGEELYAAAVLAFIERAKMDRLHQHLSLRLGADGAVRAFDGLARLGLAVRSAYAPSLAWMFRTLQRALRPYLAGVLAHSGRPPPFEAAEHDIAPRLFEDLVLAAALAGVQPKVTRTNEVFKRDVVALQELFARRFHDPTVLAEEIGLLRELGLVEVGSHLDVSSDAVASWAALSRGEQLRRHVIGRLRTLPPLASLWQVLLACESVPLLTLVELAEMEASADPELWRQGNLQRVDGPTRIDFLLMQPGVGLADVGRERVVGLAPTLRRALAGEPCDVAREVVPPHMLPSLEAVVPPECPPTTLIDLGRCLDLEAVDTVARFKLTRESIERATERGYEAETMVRWLKAASPHGLPDNVARAVRDFSVPRPAGGRWIDGPVVVVTDPARLTQLQDVLRTDEDLAEDIREVAPGVFAVAEGYAAASVRRRLVALGMLGAREDESEDAPRATPWPEDRSTEYVQLWAQVPTVPQLPELARRARVAVELMALGPQTAGAGERMAKAAAKLDADPEAYEKFIASLGDAERAELLPRLEHLLDPDRPIAEQLVVIDRVAPEWFTRVKARRRKTSAG